MNSELSDKLSSLLVETGIAHFDNILGWSGVTQEIFLSKKFPTENFAIAATLQTLSAYWANLRISITAKNISSFSLTLWNDGNVEVNDANVSWQAIYDGRK